MRVDTMRKIDRLVGVPLCFALDLLFGTFSFFKPEKSKPPQRVLFIELSEMGSTILADPAMQKLRTKAGAELFFVTFKKNAASLDILNTVPTENRFVVRDDSLFTIAADALSFLSWCRRKKIDTVVDLELFSRFTSLLSCLSGAINRVGFYAFHDEGLYRGNLLTHRVAYNPHMHIAKNFIALVNALMSEVPEHPYSKAVIDRSRNPAIERDRGSGADRASSAENPEFVSHIRSRKAAHRAHQSQCQRYASTAALAATLFRRGYERVACASA